MLGLDAGQPAIFLADLTHSPVQLRRPADACAFDLDGATAAVTRRTVLTETVQAKATVIPVHYPGRGGATLRAVADQSDVDEWLDF